MNRNQLEDKIKNVLISKKTEPSAENIVNACFETVIELIERKQKGSIDLNFETLLEVILKMKCFKLTAMTIKALRMIIKMHPSTVCNILKWHYLTINNFQLQNFNDNSLDSQLFNLLISHSNSICISNLIAKNYDINGFFNLCDEEQQTNLLANSMSAFGSHIDVLSFIKNSKSSKNNVILSYLQFRSNNPLNSDEIKEISQFVASDSPQNYQILILLFEFNRRNISKSKICPVDNGLVTIFTPHLLELTRYEIIESERDENSLIELLSLLSDSLLPHFIPLIKEINQKFLAENKFQKLLRNLISYIKIEEFAEIVQNVDISKHFIIFKGLSNVDLSVFIELYSIARIGTEFESLNLDLSKSAGFPCIASEEDALDCVISCLPSFSYYCTDYFMNIKNLILILKAHFQTHKNVICSTIERIVQSHKSNLTNLLTMNNPITLEDSKSILLHLKQSNLVFDLLNLFTESNNSDSQVALQLMIELTGIDYSSEAINVILNDSNDVSICNALRILPFFINGKKFDFDFISRILELASSSQNDMQKKAYNLLSCIYDNSATSVCICDLLYSTMKQSAASPALKNRLMLQYSILKKGCPGCGNSNGNDDSGSSLNNFGKFITELIKNLKSGNAKCKKFITELVIEFSNNNDFINFIIYNLSKKNTDISILCGSLECCLILAEHFTGNQQYLEINKDCSLFLNQIFPVIIEVSLYSQEVVKPILKILKFFNSEEFQNKISITIDSYIHQFSKKYNRELKEFCIDAEKKGFPLTRPMKTLLKFRNKSGRSKDIPVVNKPDFNKLI